MVERRAGDFGEHRHFAGARYIACNGAAAFAGFLRGVFYKSLILRFIQTPLTATFAGAWCRAFLCFRVQLLVKLFAATDMQRALGRRQIGADQIFVDFNQPGLIGSKDAMYQLVLLHGDFHFSHPDDDLEGMFDDPDADEDRDFTAGVAATG